MTAVPKLDHLILAGAIALLGGACNGATPEYRRVDLAGLSVDVPADAVERSPDTFVVKRGGQEAQITASFATPHDAERETDCPSGNVHDRVDDEDRFAYSCEQGDDIVHSVTKFGDTYLVGASDATEQVSLTVRYPAAQRDYWSGAVAHMTNSLQFQNN